MKKTMLYTLLLILVALVGVALAHPYNIKCPRDGEYMTFDHQVGYGDDAVCWYSHEHTIPGTFNTEHHEAYIPCN
jgi:hypothetical protein